MSFSFGPDAGPKDASRGPLPPFGAGAGATSPPPTNPAIPIPFSPVLPSSPFAGSSGGVSGATPPPAGGPARFPSPRRDPAAAAATAGHMERHLRPQPQAQPRLAAPFVSWSLDPSLSQRNRSPSPLSYRHVDSPTDCDDAMGNRRVVNYADPLLENGNVQASKQVRSQPSDFGRTIRSPPSNIGSMIRSPSPVVQSYPPVQITDPRHDVYKSDISPFKFGNQNQSPIHDTRSPPYPATSSSPSLVSGNHFGPGRPRPGLGGAASSPSLLGDATCYDGSTESAIAQQQLSQHLQPQSRFSAPFQSRSLDHNISKRSRSPPLSYQHVDVAEAHRDVGTNTRRLVDYTDTLFQDGNLEASKRMRSPSSELGSMIISPPSDLRSTMRSSPSGFARNNSVQNLHSHNNSQIEKSNASPSKFEKMQSPISDTHSPPHQKFCLAESCSDEHNTTSVSPPKSGILNTPKRSRTPPLDANDDDSMMPSIELEREKQAKAKRLARFGVELSRPIENVNDFAKVHKSSAGKQKRASSMEHIPMESNDDTNEGMLADIHSPESAAIVGLCPDMCPESEREERERKGDLDRYERLDGDRKQTTELLAVKKYNRTAERDADLIRPLPVLQKTMDYLLSLLNHPYDESLLGLYNFLWDRMRAIRMDLRMQHFFNQEAISMLEQMIRLHIIAMHELCEYNRGEGFSEGFDSHLNIEQMNKTSVELFQLYDDHRRKGTVFPTEKEFRGYYALLKLDKHPGYKVEPAELSLDLAKMSREIRGSPEILFAREVARACRVGNFIAFFRLARKATYLQACLMHAHFAKLRRQALASLHSGLQNTQGIPVSHVVEWLAMEGEEIEDLLEYHGFGLRQYEELYLVKEGPFLNSESDFPTNCSLLVHSKKSQRVIDDVYSGPISTHAGKRGIVSRYSGPIAATAGKREFGSPYSGIVAPVVGEREFSSPYPAPVSPTSGKRPIVSQNSGPFSPTAGKRQISSPYSSPISPTAGKKEIVSVYSGFVSPCAGKRDSVSHTQKIAAPKAEAVTAVDDEFMPDKQADSGLTVFPQGMERSKDVPLSIFNTEYDDSTAETIVPLPVADGISLDGSSMNLNTDMDEGIPPGSEFNSFQIGPHGSSTSTSDHDEYGDHEISAMEMSDDRFAIIVSPKKNEISSERLKLILRKWKQRAAERRLLREQKNALATAALSSLSLGPPVRETAAVPKHAVQELDISHAGKERDARQQRSWSRLNVSELVGRVLSERNPDAKCLCWKLLILVPPGTMESQTNHLASRWLLRKLVGAKNEDSELLASSPNLSIWNKWISSPNACCLSVVRASDQQVVGNDIINSTSCVIFMVSESIPWEVQKARLNSLLAGIPSQSNLPLLIASSDGHREGWDDASRTIIDRLGLNDVAEAKISVSSVVFLVENYLEGYANSFFDDDRLRKGLLWLANHLPLQPAVSLVKTRELLLNHLKPSLEIFNSRAVSEVDPEHCVAAFNGAVDRLAEEILAAMIVNPNQWPTPEIELLERSSSERIFAEMFLPSIGWSLPSRIQPLLAAVKSCKLPAFSSDMSWLNQGSYMGRQIPSQKSALEECLIKYLTESAQVLNEAQGASEARVMVQKGVGLELRDSFYYLVPRWVTIFRRIYNWRLAKLSTGEFSEAYVLNQHLYQTSATDSKGVAMFGSIASSNTADEISSFEGHHMMSAVSSELSLDEIIEVSCDLCVVDGPLPEAVPEQPPAQVHEEARAPADIHVETNGAHRVVNDVPVSGREQPRELMPLKRIDKLAMLLEQCSKLQDMIDEKLAIYF